VDFKETAIALDLTMKRQYLQRGGRKATEEDMLDLYVEILKLTNDRNVEMLDRGKEFMDELTPEVVSKFFKSIVKDVRKVVVPEWGPLLKMSLKSKIMGIVLSK
jgi:hypothetical protein